VDKEEQFQNKLALQGLMENAGMRIFKADLADDIAYADAQINGMLKNMSGYISEKGLNKLNFDLGRKAGLEMTLNRLMNYEDELVGDNVKSQK